ncbi:hypothetical protein C9F07_19480, partial [Salmonella enterica subsp. enterica serovar Poona]
MSNTNSGLLGIKDIVFMNVIAILSLRQIPNVAPYGASAMLLWVIAAFCLFFPLAMVCGELSCLFYTSDAADDYSRVA